MATIYKNFDFNPVETVVISGGSYTVPEGKYGLFSDFTAVSSSTQANNLVTGSYNTLSEFLLNGSPIPARTIFRLQAQCSGDRIYTYPTTSGAQSFNKISLVYLRVSGSIATSSISRARIANPGFSEHDRTIGTLEVGTTITAPVGVRRELEVNTPSFLKALIIDIDTTAANVANFEIVITDERWTRPIWLKPGDVLTATNGGSVSAIGTLYNVYK